jgi:hypothetical protein
MATLKHMERENIFSIFKEVSPYVQKTRYFFNAKNNGVKLLGKESLFIVRVARNM